MSEVRSILAEMRAQRRAHDAELRHVTEVQMGADTEFTFETMMTRQRGEMTGANVRWMFQRRYDHLEEHAIQIEDHLQSRFGLPRTQAHRYWAANEEARGELYAALMGLGDDDLDVAPERPAGEWPLRTTLEHTLDAEKSYHANCVWAVEKFRKGGRFTPMAALDDVSYPDATLDDFVRMLEDEREASLADLIGLSDEELRAPTVWMGMDCDVRFRLMRYAQHEHEHTAQIRKWRVQTGRLISEADWLMGICWQRSGRLDGILAGVPDDVLDRDPGDGEWTVREVLAHISNAERYFKRVVDEALG